MKTSSITLLTALALLTPRADASPGAAEACLARGDYGCAETDFRARYARAVDPMTRWTLMGNIAYCLVKQGQHGAALDWLIAHLPRAPSDAARADARRFVDNIVDASISKAQSRDDATAEAIARSLLDRPLDDARRFEVGVLLGRSLIAQRRYTEARRTLAAQPAATPGARDRLDALIAQCQGDLTADCAPGAESVALEVDGHLGDPRPCPATFTRVDPGPVVLVGHFRGHDGPVRVPAAISAGDHITVTLAPPPPSPVPWGPVLTASAGAATALAGVGFYFANQSAVDDLRGDPANAGLRDTADTWYALSVAAYAVGAAAVVGAGVWWTLDHDDALPVDATLEPAAARLWVTPFALGGAF